MDLASDILRLSRQIAELAQGENLDLDELQTAVYRRDCLIRDCFAAPIPAEAADEAAQFIHAVLEMDAATSQTLRNHQQRIGEELGFLRRSHKAADAYSAAEQD
ncbi:MAG: hypothetical protein FIA97_14425 [Methylococcaceae bacterium]|nr:hypothetical protein [Methylococcaceae bacterium]